MIVTIVSLSFLFVVFYVDVDFRKIYFEIYKGLHFQSAEGNEDQYISQLGIKNISKI